MPPPQLAVRIAATQPGRMPRRFKFRGMATIHRILGHVHRCQWIQEPTLEVVVRFRANVRHPHMRVRSSVGWLSMASFCTRYLQRAKPLIYGRSTLWQVDYNAHLAELNATATS